MYLYSGFGGDEPVAPATMLTHPPTKGLLEMMMVRWYWHLISDEGADARSVDETSSQIDVFDEEECDVDDDSKIGVPIGDVPLTAALFSSFLYGLKKLFSGFLRN